MNVDPNALPPSPLPASLPALPPSLLIGLTLLVLIGLAALCLLALLWRRAGRGGDGTAAALAFEPHAERLVAELAQRTGALEGRLRDEMARQAQAHQAGLGGFQQVLLTQSGEAGRTQNEQLEALRQQIALMQVQSARTLMRHGEGVTAALQRLQETQATALAEQAKAVTAQLQAMGDSVAERLRALNEANDRQLQQVRQAVDQRLAALQAGNEAKLEQMRATVDEKLQSTLEQRLGASFRQVAERLEQVHRGLGEMQGLARDVGSLNRVLTNVKTRGGFGEVQLGALLEQVFAPEQYARNVETVPGSGARVEYAIRLPGRGGAPAGAGASLAAGSGTMQALASPDSSRAQAAAGDAPLWLPIDAKFPREDHERLLDAQERADAPAAEAAARAIEQRLRAEARTIAEKYLAAPHTTDFAVLFLPTEGLYAEALRRPGLVEALQRDHRVMLAGPTTLLAVLNSLQMGFRTLALERRSAEVWQVLGAVKTEFAKFGEALARTRKKLDEAAGSIDQAEVRTRQMTRKLAQVEALPTAQAQALLGAAPSAAVPLPDDPAEEEADRR